MKINLEWDGLMAIMLLFIVAPGIYWFVGGEAYGATTPRNALVAGQIVAGLGVSFFAWMKRRRIEES